MKWHGGYEIRPMGLADLQDIVFPDKGGLGARFFEESEYPNFTAYDPMAARAKLSRPMDRGELLGLLGMRGIKAVGFILFTVNRFYTADPVGQMFLLYVTPEHRKSPLGRMLVSGACDIAKALGATVFYAGAMAGIKSQDPMFLNMLKRCDFEPLGGFARRIL